MFPTYLQDRLSSASTFGSAKVSSFINGTIELQRDPLGFKKLVILATQSGIIDAFETLSGQRVWSVKVTVGMPISLFVARTTVVKFPPVLTAVSRLEKVY